MRSLFVCGTDEHGTPIKLAAAAANLPIQEFCDQEHVRQADLYRRFGLSFDYFGRSSSPENHALTQHFYRRLDAAGLIEERDVQQVWSPRDGRFLPDRYVIGTCPNCGSQDARGDQCEACGRLLDPPDLIQPRSAISGDTLLELRWSRHLFLRQPLLVERLRAWLGTRDRVASLRPLSFARSWLSQLHDRSPDRPSIPRIGVRRWTGSSKVFLRRAIAPHLRALSRVLWPLQ